MMRVTGAGVLVGLALRRDRIILAAWLALIVLLAIGTVRYYLGVLGSEALRLDYARDIAATPALAAFGGQVDAPNIGVLSSWRMRDMSYVLIALMAILTVIRHTRAEEESGRHELIGAAVVGRFAPLTASLIVAAGASAVAAAGSALGVAALGVDPVGCLAYGLAAAGVGWVFSALAAQVASTARGAVGGAIVVLGAAYLLRFAADGSGELWLRWFTPLGWGHLLRPFADERWAVPALPLAAAAVLTGTASVLLGRRDLGAGCDRSVPARPAGTGSPGRSRWRGGCRAASCSDGSPGSPPGCSSAGWSARCTDPAPTSSPAALSCRPSSSSTPTARPPAWPTRSSGRSRSRSATPPPCIRPWRPCGCGGRRPPVTPNSCSPRRWADPGGRWVTSPSLRWARVAVLAAAGITSGLVYGIAVGEPATGLPRLLAGTLIQVPAAWVLGGVTMLAIGVLPRAAIGIAWAGFLFIQLFEVFAPIAGLDLQLAQAVVPYWHLPKVLVGGEFAAAPLLALTAVTALLAGLGLLGLHRRDLA